MLNLRTGGSQGKGFFSCIGVRYRWAGLRGRAQCMMSPHAAMDGHICLPGHIHAHWCMRCRWSAHYPRPGGCRLWPVGLLPCCLLAAFRSPSPHFPAVHRNYKWTGQQPETVWKLPLAQNNHIERPCNELPRNSSEYKWVLPAMVQVGNDVRCLLLRYPRSPPLLLFFSNANYFADHEGWGPMIHKAGSRTPKAAIPQPPHKVLLLP